MLYAHSNQENGETQELYEHLVTVGKQMQTDLAPLHFTGIEREDFSNLLYTIGLYHDLGKAMAAFQQYLRTGKGGIEKNHALISAAVFSLLFEEKDGLAYLGFLSIAKHHGSLNTEIEETGEFFRQLPKQYADFQQQIGLNPLKIAGLETRIFTLDKLQSFLKTKKYLVMKKRKSEQNFFLLQYMFSKLIWADKLDSAQIHSSVVVSKKKITDLDAYVGKKSGGKVQSLNDKRSKIKHAVLEKIACLTDTEIEEKRIFTLTAPTGTGKTLTSLYAALALSDRLEAIQGWRPRIITALPFINILEQTKADYEAIFDDVLIHHSSSRQEEATEEVPLQKRMLLTQAWESPVIITTFVQLFESILSSKNRRLLKVNKLSGSVIILDEIQALPSEYYPLLGAVIKRISDYYGARFILMTATQPEIVVYANKLLTEKKMSAIELLADSKSYYDELKRTKIIPIMDQVQTNEALVDFIRQTKAAEQSALVVVNTIAQSIALYDLLKEEYPVLYLSTNIIGEHRKKVLEEAKERLAQKVPFIMVATQTIEAGVDLDFDLGYRDLAPLESIIQVAGRVNRSGEKLDFSPLYVFETENAKNIYGTYPLKRTKEFLQEEVLENQYADVIKKYYQIMVEDSPYDEEIYEAIKVLDYDTIAQFRLIDQQDVATVIIEWDDQVCALIEKYCEMVRSKKFTFALKAEIKQIMRAIGNYTVDVRMRKLIKNKPNRFSDIYGVPLDYYIVTRDSIEHYYNETGFISEEIGVFMY